MARLTKSRSLEPVINAAQDWVRNCLIADNSVFSESSLWTPEIVEEVRHAFVDNLDEGDASFSTKLTGQMEPASRLAKRLMAEMMWVILLFPSNIKASTKRQQVESIWLTSGEALPDNLAQFGAEVLAGIGSSGTGYNNHRWRELTFLILLTRDLKRRSTQERQKILSDYDAFILWIAQVPENGDRQFRHMLRFFCFPDRVERMCSTGQFRDVLTGFGIATEKAIKQWDDRELDTALFTLRQKLEHEHPDEVLDFYEPPLKDEWQSEDDTSRQLLAVFVGQNSRVNLDHGLSKGIWGFKKTSKPDGFNRLKADDYILLASGYSGGSPRAPFDKWITQDLDQIWLAKIVSTPFESAEVEWPDEPGIPESDRYVYRIRFDPQSVRGLKGLKINDQTIFTATLAEELRKSASANGRGYVIAASNCPVLDELYSAPPDGTPEEPLNALNILFDDKALTKASEAINSARFKVEKAFLSRFVSSLAAKPFLILTGNSGTGKTKLAELFVQWLCRHNLGQFTLVPVGADWSDNRNVLGFVNHLRTTKTEDAGFEIELPIYQTTSILDLLLEAGRTENAGKPFFLILDEMNLSHVERYFADFLSALESKDARLFLHREGRSLPRKQNGKGDVPETFVLPRNVFVIGTVNVDETTYMFSPKVLDRANVIEFRTSTNAPMDFLKKGGQGIAEIAPAPDGYARGFLDLSLRTRGIAGPQLALVADPEEPPEDAKDQVEKCHATIADLFTLMQKRHQEFAFRSMAEMLRFLAVDYELSTRGEKWNWNTAMDAQILQKILPKLHGSKRKIGSLLSALAKYCEHRNITDAEALLTDEIKAEVYLSATSDREKNPLFKESFTKLCEMMEAVRRDQFVSFIQ